jgi:hypothetical protein
MRFLSPNLCQYSKVENDSSIRVYGIPGRKNDSSILVYGNPGRKKRGSGMDSAAGRH